MATAGQVRTDRLPDAPRDPDGRIDLDVIVDALGHDRSILLGSAPGTPHAIPWSFVALTSGSYLEDDGARTVWHSPAGEEELDVDPFRALELACERLGLDPRARPAGDSPPFTGGLVGALSYDLARRIERLPARAGLDRDQPHLHLELVTTTIAIDHRTEEAFLVHREGQATDPVSPRALAARLRNARSEPERGPAGTGVSSTLGRGSYLEAVAAVLERIAQGDVFQVNLTQRLTGGFEGDVHALYRRLRRVSPAPHGAVVPAIGLASVSPESFLLVEEGRVRTRPMKGTRPRRPGDDSGRTELEHSAKDRAENVMVVDIQRNDLGRVCVPGSVTVPTLCEVEAHPTVWQLVSTVEGELLPALGWGELLRRTFPSGSITGAPKVAAMELIESLEPVRRGWYCGAVGWIGAGSLRLSVAIRTAVLDAATVDYGAGGGIVADSDPEREYAESLVKAEPFLTALGGTLVEAAP